MRALPPVRVVFFDMGGTIESLVQNDALRLEACRQILQRLRREHAGVRLTPEALLARIKSGTGRYFADRESTLRELCPAELWPEYLLRHEAQADPRLGQTLAGIGEELAFIWDCVAYRREVRPEALEVVTELRRRGYRTGVISNTFSAGQVAFDLARFGLDGLMDPVVVSTACGMRKPGAAIFHAAAQLAGAAPSECAYVGDSLAYDIGGAQSAGFTAAVLIVAPGVEDAPAGAGAPKPDATIRSLDGLLSLLPGVMT